MATGLEDLQVVHESVDQDPQVVEVDMILDGWVSILFKIGAVILGNSSHHLKQKRVKMTRGTYWRAANVQLGRGSSSASLS